MRAFNAWEANAEASMASLHELMSRSLRSLHNIPLRFGMNSWSSFAAERSAQLSALQSAASALRSRVVRAALNSWVEHAVASAESERMLRKAASSLSPACALDAPRLQLVERGVDPAALAPPWRDGADPERPACGLQLVV